jgi:4-hydroxybenzoate polyprenyltransferase
LTTVDTNQRPTWSARVRLVSQFVRFSAMGATVVMPLAGAVTAGRPIPGRVVLGVAAVGVAYHLFGFVLNDVCDLDVDRTEPRRAGSPLVQGRVSPTMALAFALVNIPVAFAILAWLDASERAVLVLALSIALGAAYDVFGKRSPWPPVTDLVQGLAWATLGWLGAELAGGATTVTVFLMAFFVAYILMTNGAHASLRDLANDVRHGARTTAIVLGATPLPDGGATVPVALRAYALVLQLAMVALSGGMLVALGYTGATAVYATTAWLALSGLSLALLVAAGRQTQNRAASMVAGTQHLIVALGVVIALLAPRMSWGLRLLAVGGYVGPLLTYGWLVDSLRRRRPERLWP